MYLTRREPSIGSRWSERHAIGILYAGVVGLLCLLLVGLLTGPIRAALPEDDLSWMLPTMSYYVDGKSLGEVLGFLFSPAPLDLGQPVLKMYLALVLIGSGVYTSQLILVSVGVHFLNALLLYWLCRQLDVSRRVSVVAATIYLTLFAHFHAYMWPPAAQHIIAVFTILLILDLYLLTERRVQSRAPYRWPFIAAWGVTLFASLQRSTLIVPVSILTHILACSRDAEERLSRYERWLPMFMCYLIYPSFALTFVGDPKLTTGLVKLPLPPLGNALVVLAVGSGCLLALWMLLRLIPRYRSAATIGRVAPGVAVVGLIVVSMIRDHRQILLPYNAFLPFTATLASFLEPLEAVFLIDSTEPYHHVSAEIGGFRVIASLIVVAAFLVTCVRKKKQLLMLVAWYVVCLMYLLGPNLSFAGRIPSRYFVYVSPVFAVVIASMLVGLHAVLLEGTRLRPFTREVILAGVLVGLCVPNMVAIKLEMYRGRLANTYLIYEDVRLAETIRQDLQRPEVARRREAPDIHVANVTPMPVKEFWEFSPLDPARYETFRDVMSEVFREKKKRGIHVNETPTSGRPGAMYMVSGHRIKNADGGEVDPFGRLLDDAVARMRGNRYQEARELLRRALEERPFLLRYVLASNRLDDLRWITNGLDMHAWVNKIAAVYGGWSDVRIAKNERVAATMNGELSDYVQCLFYLAYLENRAGRTEESRQWLSRIQFLERDPEVVSSWIGKVPLVRDDQAIAEFLERLKDPAYFRDPLPWRAGDYAFPRFLLRFLFPRGKSWDGYYSASLAQVVVG